MRTTLVLLVVLAGCKSSPNGARDAGAPHDLAPSACNLPSLPSANPDKATPPAAFLARYGSYPTGINADWSSARTLWLGSAAFAQGIYNGDKVPYQQNYNELFFGTFGDLLGDGSTVMVQASWAASTPADEPGSLHVLRFKSDGSIASVALTDIDGSANPVIGAWLGSGKQILVPGFHDAPVTNAPSYLVSFDGTSFTKTMVGMPLASHTSFAGDWSGTGAPSVLAITYSDSQGNPRPILFQPDGKGGIATQYFGSTDGLSGSSIAFADLDGNGRQDFITGDTSSDPPTSDHHAWIFYGQSDGSFMPVELPAPYFYGSTFDGADNEFMPVGNWTAADVRTHQIAARVLDLDGDGKLDIVISSMIWSNHTPFGVIQMLIQQADGSFVDDTANRLFNFDLRREGAHQLWFTDVNGDGFPDLLLSDGSVPEINDGTNDNTEPGISCFTQANELLINDGQGHFVSVMKDGFCKFESSNPHYVQKFIPWVSGNRLGYVEITNYGGPLVYRYTWAAPKTALSTGPSFYDPAACGVPGFNEWYYLLHYADARAAVDAGHYASGLAFYLAVGRKRGDKINAK